MDFIKALIIDDETDSLSTILTRIKEIFNKRQINFDYTPAASIINGKKILLGDNTFDVVLLDIGKVADKHLNAVQELQDVHPYLPIIMFSNQNDPDQIINYIDCGARSFIMKARLVTGIKPLDRSSQEAIDANWNNILDKLEKFVKEYRPLKRILSDPLEDGVIVKSDFQNPAVKDQAEFLKGLENYPDVAKIFAKVTNGPWTDNDNRINFEMPFYRMKSFRQLLFQEVDQQSFMDISKEILNKVLNVLLSDLYKIQKTNEVNETYTYDTHLKKYSDRIIKLESIISRLISNGNSPFIDEYKKILGAKTLSINDITYTNPSVIIDEIIKDKALQKMLVPPFLCTIHGDLHFDNILVDDRLLKKTKIKLVDPRGFKLGSSDQAYDIGKLLHSTSGKYDFIHLGHLKVDMNKSSFTNSNISINFNDSAWGDVPLKGGGSGARLTSHKRIMRPWLRSAFDELTTLIKSRVDLHAQSEGDKHLWIRSKFSEAMHFCTMGIFHIEEDANRALAILVRGIQLINDFYRDYQSGVFNTDRK